MRGTPHAFLAKRPALPVVIGVESLPRVRSTWRAGRQSDLVLLFARRLPCLAVHYPRPRSSPSCRRCSSPSCRRCLLMRAPEPRSSRSSRRCIVVTAVAVWVLANTGFAVAALGDCTKPRTRSTGARGVVRGTGQGLHSTCWQQARKCECAWQIMAVATSATREEVMGGSSRSPTVVRLVVVAERSKRHKNWCQCEHEEARASVPVQTPGRVG